MREYMGKGKEFSEVRKKEIKWIENKVNNGGGKRVG